MALDSYKTARFKIDFNGMRSLPFELFYRRLCWHRFVTGLTWWERVDCFSDRTECVALYEKIKDLPQYLD
jgi:hypothetical protein